MVYSVRGSTHSRYSDIFAQISAGISFLLFLLLVFLQWFYSASVTFFSVLPLPPPPPPTLPLGQGFPKRTMFFAG